METTTEKTISHLNMGTASVVSTTYVTVNDKKVQLGNPLIECYGNTEEDQDRLIEEQPKNIVDTILTFWNGGE